MILRVPMAVHEKGGFEHRERKKRSPACQRIAILPLVFGIELFRLGYQDVWILGEIVHGFQKFASS
jgi:hypothetical protein